MEVSVNAPIRSVTGKVMVYDGECPMCAGISGAFVRAGLFPEGERKAYQDYEGELSTRMWDKGIRNEILVLEPATGELRSGAAAILWMLRATWIGWLSRVFERRPFVDGVSLVYRFIAYNRRFLSVPRPKAIACACDPDDRPVYQVLLIATFGAFAAITVTLLGSVAPPEVRLMGSRLGSFAPLIKMFWPWTFPVLCALTLGRGERLKYIAHLASTAGAGGLVLLPLGLLGLASPGTIEFAFTTLLQLSCIGAGGLMFAMQWRRVTYLKLGSWWLWMWSACAGFGLATLGWMHKLG